MLNPRVLTGKRFRLKVPTLGLALIDDKRIAVPIPAGSIVAVTIEIAIPHADPAQRGCAGCPEDDAHRRIPERSSDECHPPNRSPQKPTEAHRNSLSLEVFEAGVRSDK
jgi:hypothetical protein